MKNIIKYRPEIDGLRAIAVLSVFIFHLNSNWLPGGFLGVDVFFVVSGFLITQIIIEHLLQGKFSFSDFYARRIKRIYPMSLLIVLLVLIATYFLFDKDDFIRVKKTSDYTYQFLTNFYLSKKTGYFDLDSHSNPYLHYWSLAIEEQFYFLFPFLIVIAYKLFKTTKYLLWLCLFLFLTSFLWSIFSKHPNAYFLSQLRFFEILIGAIIAIVSQHTYLMKYALKPSINGGGGG
uniref:acyltransferase family protein n=1 Tax=Basilea psittacipulmonis TaxID=1472345 RepID=UPI001178B8C1